MKCISEKVLGLIGERIAPLDNDYDDDAGYAGRSQLPSFFFNNLIRIYYVCLTITILFFFLNTNLYKILYLRSNNC